ncbi:MAG TPA: long-chain fatty acid--CoA ligase [Streptosporangiaceae bacterium]|jgi:acyl-CoA synthetase (AMP-forming)/AMP-acid ligase II
MYVTQGLHRAMRETPDAPATIFGERSRTWAQHADRVARLAGALHELGVQEGERVGIWARNSDRYAELLAAVPWANAVLNPLNSRWSPHEIGYALRESDTNVLFVDDPVAVQVPALAGPHPDLEVVIHLGDGTPPAGMLDYEELVAGARPVPDARRGGDALAAIFYTGGTTGFPKGVMLSHANLLTSALGSLATAPIALPGGRTVVAAPMFHASGFVAWLYQLVVGGGHVILPAFEATAVLEAITRHQAASIILVPTMIQMLLDHPAFGDYDLSSLQTLLYAASPMSQTLLERVRRTLPHTALIQAYGMTELAPITTLLSPADHQAAGHRRSVGRAAAHAEVRVVDEHDHEVPRGSVGEIVARGGHVMLGYWNNPKPTAKALRDGWMHTGDVGYLDDDGYLYVVDRIKDMIITGGSNVFSAEVENAVGTHPAVVACAVIGVPDATWGERVHAVIVVRPGHTTTADEVRAHCKNLIADYKAPRSCEFVEALPLSPAGKVLKHQLREPYWRGAERQVH